MAEDFKALIEAQKETTRMLMSAEQRAEMDAAIAEEHHKDKIKSDNRIEAGRKAWQTRQANKESSAGGSAAKEDAQEKSASDKKNQNLLGKIASGVTGMFGKMGEKVKGAGKGIWAILKGTLVAGLMIALLAFLESDTWKSMKETIVTKLIPKLKTFYKDTLKPFVTGILDFIKDPSWENFKKIFDVKDPMGLVMGLAGITALFAPGLLFAGLKLGIKAFKGALNLAGAGIGKMFPKTPGAAAKPGAAARRAAPGPAGRRPSGFKPGAAAASGRAGAPGRITKVAKGLTTMGKAAGQSIGLFIGGVLKGIGAGLTAIANPAALLGLAAVSAAILAISAAIRIMEPAFEPIGKMMESFGETIKSVFEGIGEFVESTGTAIKAVVVGIGEAIGNVIDKITSMSTAGTEATTNQIKELSAIPASGLHAAASGIDAMKLALSNFGGGTFSKVAESLFGGSGPIDKLIDLAKNVAPLMKAAEAISVISAAGGDYAMAQAELKRRERVAELESGIAAGSLKGEAYTSEADLKAARAELSTLKQQKMQLQLSGNRAMGGPVTKGKKYNTHFGEGTVKPELFIPDSSGMILSAQRTEQIMQAGLQRGAAAGGGSGPSLVNAPVNTINNSQSNTTVTSTELKHPSAILNRVNLAA